MLNIIRKLQLNQSLLVLLFLSMLLWADEPNGSKGTELMHKWMADISTIQSSFMGADIRWTVTQEKNVMKVFCEDSNGVQRAVDEPGRFFLDACLTNNNGLVIMSKDMALSTHVERFGPSGQEIKIESMFNGVAPSLAELSSIVGYCGPTLWFCGSHCLFRLDGGVLKRECCLSDFRVVSGSTKDVPEGAASRCGYKPAFAQPCADSVVGIVVPIICQKPTYLEIPCGNDKAQLRTADDSYILHAGRSTLAFLEAELTSQSYNIKSGHVAEAHSSKNNYANLGEGLYCIPKMEHCSGRWELLVWSAKLKREVAIALAGSVNGGQKIGVYKDRVFIWENGAVPKVKITDIGPVADILRRCRSSLDIR